VEDKSKRISIARELYKDIDIILDEANFATPGTEKIIQESIESLKGKYTILMVAHRLRIKKCGSNYLIRPRENTGQGIFSD
jgi:subfamily B ATP-binding cassette protein MsbA